MRIIHTADWHLGRRQRRVDRSSDLRAAIARVMDFCESRNADILVIAGDVFDSVCRPDDVCAAVELLRNSVQPFLSRGGTVLAVTGNHDGETFCRTIGHALGLVDPTVLKPGDPLAPGRFHLFTRPALHRVSDRSGQQVQFVLMPYPLASRYLDDADPQYQGGSEGRHRQLREKFAHQLARIRSYSQFDASLHSVLVSHLFLPGATLPNGRIISADDEKQDVVCPSEDLGSGWAYVALGHIHKPQAVGDLGNVRYSGSIERLAFDERDDKKEIVFLEIGPNGLRGQPELLPLESTPFLDVEIDQPGEQLPTLHLLYPHAERTLVRCRVTYTAGLDDPDEIYRRIDQVFPRWYSLEVIEASRTAGPRPGRILSERRGFRDTVMDHLKHELEGQEIAEAVYAEAEKLIEEIQR
jgi:DNA repair protein SbcD/Mre11